MRPIRGSRWWRSCPSSRRNSKPSIGVHVSLPESDRRRRRRRLRCARSLVRKVRESSRKTLRLRCPDRCLSKRWGRDAASLRFADRERHLGFRMGLDLPGRIQACVLGRAGIGPSSPRSATGSTIAKGVACVRDGLGRRSRSWRVCHFDLRGEWVKTEQYRVASIASLTARRSFGERQDPRRRALVSVLRGSASMCPGSRASASRSRSTSRFISGSTAHNSKRDWSVKTAWQWVY